MKQTKGAIGNLINRYRAVLKKCHLLNTFGSLAVASMLVMGGAGVAAAAADGTWTKPDGTQETWTAGTVIVDDNYTLSGTYEGSVSDKDNTAGVAAINYGVSGVTVADGTTFRNNSIEATSGAAGGALKILNGTQIGNNVTFDGNKATDGNAWGGGALYIKTTDNGNPDTNQTTVSIGNNALFTNNQAKTWGGAIALEYGNLTIGDGAQFLNNKTTATYGDAHESGGGAIAVWHDPSNGNPMSSLTVSKALFDGNETTVGGGAIYNKDGQIAIDSTQFKNNSSDYHGGAISNESGNTNIDGTIVVTNSIFENNTSGNGGAIWQGTDGVATITGSTFSNNTAMTGGAQQGGAITTASEMRIASTTFTGNQAGKLGGAIANVNPSGLDSKGLTLADVTFDGNSAGEKGGALYNDTQNSVTFTGTNVFRNNTVNELANDIHNSGSVTVASGTTSLGSGYTQDNGSLAVNGGATLESLGTMDISGGKVTFDDESNIVVNGSKITEQAAIKLSGSAVLDVAEGANLLISDAVDGQSYNIVDKGSSATADTWQNVASTSNLIELSMDENGDVKGSAKDAANVLPGLSSDIASQVNGITSIANRTNSEYAGVRFLARATDSRYLGNDTKAAVSTIESAARIAFAGAVPQMTKMASDAATNAVVNRLGFANPDNGAKAMNVDGKLVDDKALGLALWIAPLWSNQTGFGMEAGNLDYGYNANLGGISLGADYTWASNIRAGLMFNIGGGYAESAGGDLSETTNSMTFWGVGAYGGWEYKNLAVMADVSYTSTWNSVDQDVDHRMGMGDLEADIQASAISAGLRFEYKLETQYLDLIPHVGARYMSINTWGYDVETNGGTVLEGDGFQQNIWTFPVGITFSKELEMNNDWYFKPSVDFTVIPAAGDIKAKEDVRFTGLPYSTEIETQMMDYFTWQGGVGLEFGNDNMSVGVNYTLQAGQNSTGHGVFGMFRYEF